MKTVTKGQKGMYPLAKANWNKIRKFIALEYYKKIHCR